MVINTKGRQLCFITLNLPPNTNGWQKYDITFNSLDSDTLNVYWDVWGPISGSFWLDDLILEEVPFVNLVRRSGAPLSVSHSILVFVYTEGVDYDSLFDPKLGRVYSWYGEYDAWHQPPTFRRNPNGKLRNGDTILMSYYHTTYVYDGQVIVSTTEPKTYEIIEKEFKILDNLIKPKTYFMNHDEIRLLNWDWGDQQQGTNPAGLLARNVNKSADIIKNTSKMPIFGYGVICSVNSIMWFPAIRIITLPISLIPKECLQIQVASPFGINLVSILQFSANRKCNLIEPSN